MKAENLEDLVKRFLYKSGNGNQDPESGAWAVLKTVLAE
jgi:hypothetical protein